MVVIIFFAVRWIRRQLAGQELLELRSTRILSGERGPQVRGSVYEWPASTSSARICCCRSCSSPAISAAGWIRLFAPTRRRIRNRTE